MAAMNYADFTSPEADKLLIVRFYHDAVENKFKSHHEGRPIFDDIEMLEVNLPGDRARSLLVPAHAEWKRFGRTIVTYAERFKEHYARFKANEGPVVEGTPLSEAPFLSMGDKASLKALQVYTIEQLASLEGQQLKNIGSGGRSKQQAAIAYLTNASGTADTVKLHETIADLRRQLAERDPMDHDGDGNMGGVAPHVDGPVGEYESMTAASLKDHIKAKTGSAPRGNPSQATLVAMAYELDREDQPAAA